MASFVDQKVIGDLTFGDLRARPLRLIDAIAAADPETMIAFRKRVKQWGGDRQAVGELLKLLLNLMCLHTEGREADADLLTVISSAMARAEAPSRPVIERTDGGYTIKRVTPDEPGGKRFWVLWRAVLKPLVDLVLDGADRIGGCKECGALFIGERPGPRRVFCGDACRMRASRRRRAR